jgi:flagella basal body P-ring formation protein FlgA
MSRFVLLEGEELLVRDVVRYQAAGGMQSLLNQPLDVATSRLSLIPPRLVRQTLKCSAQGSFVVVGSRCQVIPLTKFPLSVTWFYRALLDFLDSTDSKQEGRLEVEILSVSDIPATEAAGPLKFTLLKAERRLGYLAGEAEVAYSLEGRKRERGFLRLWIHQFIPLPKLRREVHKGEVVTLDGLAYVETDVSLASPQELVKTMFLSEGESYMAKRNLSEGSVLSQQDVEQIKGPRAGDRITILFRKGNVRLEVPGKVYRSATVGEAVAVYTLEGHQRFNGTVTGPKEVEVEIP